MYSGTYFEISFFCFEDDTSTSSFGGVTTTAEVLVLFFGDSKIEGFGEISLDAFLSSTSFVASFWPSFEKTRVRFAFAFLEGAMVEDGMR